MDTTRFAPGRSAARPMPTAYMPARRAASIPAAASSKTTQFAGSTPGEAAPRRKTWDDLAKTIKDKTGAAGLCLLAKDNAGGK